DLAAHAGEVRLDGVRPDRGARPAADGNGARAEPREQPGACRVVDVDDGDRIGLPAVRQVLREEPRLGREVPLDVAVKVEVIAGQVREYRRVEPRPRDAVLLERVRRDLDRDVRRPGRTHAGEETLER